MDLGDGVVEIVGLTEFEQTKSATNDVGSLHQGLTFIGLSKWDLLPFVTIGDTAVHQPSIYHLN